MKYRLIDKDTVQCIVTGEDLEEYGLTLMDIIQRNERGEGFLRGLIEEAHEEVGYSVKGNNIAMSISPLKDNGMVVTFSEQSEASVKNFLDHMKEVLASMGIEGLETLHGMENSALEEFAGNIQATEEKNKNEKPEEYAEVRMFEFTSLNDAIVFASKVEKPSELKSCLVKCDELFYLITMKNRMSWKRYNKTSAMAFDFAKVITDVDEKLIYLGEHGEALIENGALAKLKRVN